VVLGLDEVDEDVVLVPGDLELVEGRAARVDYAVEFDEVLVEFGGCVNGTNDELEVGVCVGVVECVVASNLE
jgi:hypothetical protein